MGSIKYIPQVKRFIEYYTEAITGENEEYQILLAIENLLYSVNQVLDCYAHDKLLVSVSSEDENLTVYIIIGENFVGKDGVEIYTTNYVNIIRKIISLIELEINRSYLSLDVNIPTIPGFRNREVEQGTIEIRIYGENMSGKFTMKQKVSIKKELPATIPGTPLSEIPVRRNVSQSDPTSRSLCGLLPYLCCLPSIPGASPSTIKQMLDRRRKTIASNARRSVQQFLLKYNSRIPFNLAVTEPADSPCCSDFDSSDSGIEQNTDRTEDKYPDSQDPFFEGEEKSGVKLSKDSAVAGWFSRSSDSKPAKSEVEKANFDFRYAEEGETEKMLEPTSPVSKKEKRKSRADSRTTSPKAKTERSLSFKADQLTDSVEDKKDEGKSSSRRSSLKRKDSIPSREPSKDRKRSNSIFRISSRGKADKMDAKKKEKEEKEKEKEKKKAEKEERKRGKSKGREVERNDSLVLSDTERRDSDASGALVSGTPRRKSIFGKKEKKEAKEVEKKEAEEKELTPEEQEAEELRKKEQKDAKRKEKKEKRRKSKPNVTDI